LARRQRLYGTRVGSELAESARRKGAVVIDRRLPEGQTVADALGAVDLDRWGQMLDAARWEPLLDGPNRLLRRHGEALSVLASGAVTEEAAVIDLGPLGRTVPGVPTKRLILVHPAHAWIAEARAQHASAPEAATFMVLEGLARRLDLPTARRRRLLGEAAQAAILASFAGGPP